MLYLAYDGSINGDWISRYAIRLAANDPQGARAPGGARGRLTLLHVRDGATPDPRLAHKLARIERECRLAAVALEVVELPRAGGVFESLREALTPGSESFLVCGTRIRPGARGVLAGTVAQRLLAHAHCNVLALRVVHPGLLGSPDRLLMPVGDYSGGAGSGLPFLRLFRPDLRRIHLLHVMSISGFAYRRLWPDPLRRMRRAGQDYLRPVAARMVQDLELDARAVETVVRVADEWAREITVFAARHRSRLIYAGASERNLGAQYRMSNPLEQLLRDPPCDVGIYRGPE